MKTAHPCRMDGPGTGTLTYTVGLQCDLHSNQPRNYLLGKTQQSIATGSGFCQEYKVSLLILYIAYMCEYPELNQETCQTLGRFLHCYSGCKGLTDQGLEHWRQGKDPPSEVGGGTGRPLSSVLHASQGGRGAKPISSWPGAESLDLPACCSSPGDFCRADHIVTLC